MLLAIGRSPVYARCGLETSWNRDERRSLTLWLKQILLAEGNFLTLSSETLQRPYAPAVAVGHVDVTAELGE